MGGADGESNLVPEAIGKAVGEGLGARLAFEAVVVADLLSHSTAFQLKVTAGEKKKRGQKSEPLEVQSEEISNVAKKQLSLKSRGFSIWIRHTFCNCEPSTI